MALGERLVRDSVVGVFFHASSCPLLIQKKKKKWEKKLLPIDPRITDTIGELFFLSP